jgi:hypothetical protein
VLNPTIDGTEGVGGFGPPMLSTLSATVARMRCGAWGSSPTSVGLTRQMGGGDGRRRFTKRSFKIGLAGFDRIIAMAGFGQRRLRTRRTR